MTIQEIINSDDIAQQKALFQFDSTDSDEAVLLKFNLWARYFFVQYFKSLDAPFHKEINKYNLDIYRNKLNVFVDIAFKGAGKDVKTKLFIAFVILNDIEHTRRYFKVLSEDGGNSKQSVTDIYNMLVEPRIVQMYPDTFSKTVFKREESMGSFTTNSGIKVLADTIYTSQRGDVQEASRPDFIWFNDFETRKTLRSALITKNISDNMEEARTGLELGGGCVYTCNYISEMGNVHRLVIDKNSDRKKVLIVPIKDVQNIPTWKRYSIEEINEMEVTDEDFEGERLCKPSASKDVYFDREMLDKMLVREPIQIIAEFKMFRKYNPSHRYAGGMDTAGGVGLNSSTSVFIDFDCVPAQVVGTFVSNTILPEAFGDEIYSQANRFGGSLVCPENNKYDQTILKARQLGAKLYTGIGKIIQIHTVAPTTFGWRTDSLSKSRMLSSMREAIESGLIELNDKDLINEFKSYTRNDLIDREIDARLTTRHFDLLIACCIAWQMKDHARPNRTFMISNEVIIEETNPAI